MRGVEVVDLKGFCDILGDAVEVFLDVFANGLQEVRGRFRAVESSLPNHGGVDLCDTASVVIGY